MSCCSNKFLNYLETAREVKKPQVKYSKNKYKTETHTQSLNSPLSEAGSQSTSSIKNSLKKGKLKIINNWRSRQKKKKKIDYQLTNTVNEMCQDGPCLIQAPPSMKAVSNFKTMREASLPRSISAKGKLVDVKRSGKLFYMILIDDVWLFNIDFCKRKNVKRPHVRYNNSRINLYTSRN